MLQCLAGETIVLEHCRGHRSSNKKNRVEKTVDGEEISRVRDALNAIVVPKNQTTVNEQDTYKSIVAKRTLKMIIDMPDQIAQIVQEMIRIGQTEPDVNNRYIRASKNVNGKDLSENMLVKRAVLTIVLSFSVSVGK